MWGGFDGYGVALTDEDEAAVEEKLALQSIPGMAEPIREGMATPVEECSEEPGWPGGQEPGAGITT
ncbi:MAG: hypothetical protein NT029_12425 [Armatimonadetes bacterium]|nr:hypothetical protein [Armatimonadota bacterium]